MYVETEVQAQYYGLHSLTLAIQRPGVEKQIPVIVKYK
jgi:hypothetical protein